LVGGHVRVVQHHAEAVLDQVLQERAQSVELSDDATSFQASLDHRGHAAPLPASSPAMDPVEAEKVGAAGQLV